MTFRQFAFNNVLRNKRLYVAYFLSSLFTVMVFFTFAIFAFHPAFHDGAINADATYGMSVAGGIIYVFSFFFVLYSMSSFLQSRKREFGLLMIQGMSTRQIRLMVFLENMLIGFIATVGGIGLGLVFAKAILLLAENVLIISESLDFYFPVMAIVVTFLSFIVLFLFISLFVSFVLRTNKLIELIKSNKKSKGEPKASLILTIIAALLLTFGYGAALYVKGEQVVVALVPVVIVVIIATYLLFTQLSVYFIGRLKKNQGIFWRKTNMLLFSDLAFRMKDNARTFFMVAIISTVAFSAIGTLFGFQSYITGGLKEANPYTFTYGVSSTEIETKAQEDSDMSSNENSVEFRGRVEEGIHYVDASLQEEGIKTNKENMEMRYYDIGTGQPVLIVKASDYNKFASLLGKKEVNPEKNEAIVVKEHVANMMNSKTEETLMEIPIKLKDDRVIQAYTMITSNVISEMNAYYIVNDEVYNFLPASSSYMNFTAWQAAKGQEDAVLKAGETLSEQFSNTLPEQLGNGSFFAIDYIVYQTNKFYGPVMFIGLFIGIVFFVSAGSFLYFRLYTDLDYDKEKFKGIAKMGLTNVELKKVINRQTALLFFAPIVVALVHGAVALTALSHMFNYNLFMESAIVLGSFAVIQIVYFVIVRHFYTKQIKVAVK